MVGVTPAQRRMLIKMHEGLDAERLDWRDLKTCDALVRRGLARLEFDTGKPSIYWLTEEGVKHSRLS